MTIHRDEAESQTSAIGDKGISTFYEDLDPLAFHFCRTPSPSTPLFGVVDNIHVRQGLDIASICLHTHTIT